MFIKLKPKGCVCNGVSVRNKVNKLIAQINMNVHDMVGIPAALLNIDHLGILGI